MNLSIHGEFKNRQTRKNSIFEPVSQSVLLSNLTLFRMSPFGAAHGRAKAKKTLPKICHIYPTMMKLGTVIPYLKKIQKIYKSRDTPLEFY